MIETNNTTDLRGVIAQRAYELYQLRGAHPGREFDDWLEAEREVLSSSSPAAEEPPAPKPARKRAAKSPAPTTTPRKRTTKKGE
jgi:Protein of unknown function (DUF2934)